MGGAGSFGLGPNPVHKRHVTAWRGHASEIAEPQQDSGPTGGYLVCRAGAVWAPSNPLKAKDGFGLGEVDVTALGSTVGH